MPTAPESENAPANKRESIFTSRRTQLSSIEEALGKFAAQVCSPEVAANIRDMITGKGKGKMLKITASVQEDFQRPGKFCCQLKTNLSRQLAVETFSNLD